MINFICTRNLFQNLHSYPWMGLPPPATIRVNEEGQGGRIRRWLIRNVLGFGWRLLNSRYFGTPTKFSVSLTVVLLLLLWYIIIVSRNSGSSYEESHWQERIVTPARRVADLFSFGDSRNLDFDLKNFKPDRIHAESLLAAGTLRKESTSASSPKTNSLDQLLTVQSPPPGKADKPAEKLHVVRQSYSSLAVPHRGQHPGEDF